VSKINKGNIGLKMSSPYEKHKNTSNWRIIEEALNNLVENKDIELTTASDYVIGYLCEKLDEETNKAKSNT
jgi:hypothetical protein